MPKSLGNAEIARRTAEAERAAERGQTCEAAALYQRLGMDIQSACGRFDPRALDAFELVARTIARASE
ncbi:MULTISPECIES: hypothetical protein [unclassified Streptomyces]|uniref:hypothetical protein n=1 Tax=unclassified Streptomyces TaxID=2593676 RepID=UPI00081F69B4|nr:MULTISPECIES: hypothetical protein [unclassified Streptomyces]MYR28724.1 hypothetical protein [Streptomyces sp. SID4945]SCF40757.1 hypothetical protein GA0115257_115712 [Streptomyces sp. LcepLS]